ncbi:hypothetical protein JCM10295v2_003670 [Rhodotorula toruloides]
MTFEDSSTSGADIEKMSVAPATHLGEDKPTTTLREDVAAYGLEKVFQRHGRFVPSPLPPPSRFSMRSDTAWSPFGTARIDLTPLPSDDPHDPYNWSSWVKHALLIQVAFHAMMGPFSAAAVIPSFETFVKDFGITITQASYLVSVPILFLGVTPLVAAPISARVGRRPILLGSAILSAAVHVGGAYCHSYGTLMVTRVLQAILLAPPQSLGADMVNEMFFQHEKGQKLGIWTLLTALGPPVAPLVMGPLVWNTGKWQWTFYLLAIINLVQFILYVFLAPETAGFVRPARGVPGMESTLSEPPRQKTPWWKLYFSFKRTSSAPWSRVPYETVHPFVMVLRPTVLLPALAYAITFSYTNVLLTVEIPALLGRKYKLNPQQIGLQYISSIIGASLGEVLAGTGSDWWMLWRTKRANGNREPEMRIPFGLPGFVIGAVGTLVFGIQLQNTAAGRWNVTPLIGVAIALFGLQIVTTVVYSYAIEATTRKHQHLVSPFVGFMRQIYAFTAPFYLTMPFEEWDYTKGAGLLVALIGIVSFALLFVCQVFGRRWRQREAEDGEIEGVPESR